MRKPKNKYAVTIYLLFILFCIAVLILSARTHFIMPFLLICTIVLYAISRQKINFKDRDDIKPVSGLFFILAAASALFSITSIDKQVAMYATPFVDGYKTESTFEDVTDEGVPYENTNVEYIPNTKKGGNVIKAIKYSITILTIIFGFLSWIFYQNIIDKKKLYYDIDKE